MPLFSSLASKHIESLTHLPPFLPKRFVSGVVTNANLLPPTTIHMRPSTPDAEERNAITAFTGLGFTPKVPSACYRVYINVTTHSLPALPPNCEARFQTFHARQMPLTGVLMPRLNVERVWQGDGASPACSCGGWEAKFIFLSFPSYSTSCCLIRKYTVNFPCFLRYPKPL